MKCPRQKTVFENIDDLIKFFVCINCYIDLTFITALHVHACEWNPEAVVALQKGLQRNKVEDRCTVYAGDKPMHYC